MPILHQSGLTWQNMLIYRQIELKCMGQRLQHTAVSKVIVIFLDVQLLCTLVAVDMLTLYSQIIF